MKCEWKSILAKDFIEFNPKITLKKGTITKKVAMDKVLPYKKYINEFEYANYTGGSKFQDGDTIMARITPCLENGKTAFVDFLDENEVGFGSTEFIVLRERKGISDAQYIYYLSISPQFRKIAISSMVGSSGRQRVQQSVLDELELFVPDINEQRRIANILNKIDEKIRINNRINDNLEKLLVYMYENMIKNHTDWTNATLDQFCNIFTGKKNANQYNKNGIYKFFTCGEKILRINSYIFDGPAIIISGNGSYTGRTLFYNGKFDLYQRTYACTLKPNIPNSYIYGLYIILKVALHKKISGGTHGSSIPYIVMNDIAKFEFKLNYELFKIFSNYAKNILTLIQKNDFESQKLSDIRNVFLPKLMNNDINISDFYL